jgi:hypothetical protein
MIVSGGVREHIGFESLGVRLRLTADSPEVLERIPRLLPPGASACEPASADAAFGVLKDPAGTYQFTRDDSPVSSGLDLEFALMLLDNQIRIYVGINAPNRIFIHAGVVGLGERAIVMPGRSFTGKTSLVLALVRAGATYYSDEFAVIDEHGQVHPYARLLTLRDEANVQTDHAVETFGGVAGDRPLPVGAVVFAEYRPNAVWQPQTLSAGRGVLGMLSNALAALQRSEEALRILKRSVRGAVLVEGQRGEAAEAAEALLDLVRA